MASNADLEIKIGAQTKDLEAGLNKASNSVKKFERATGTVANSTKKMGKATANAVPSVTEFSRVIQDAPFGIQGVANNITQLTQQFGHLSKNAGGTKAALKAMLGTLAGPAGILLVVSAVTSLMVSYGDTMFKTKSDVEKLKEEQEELTKALEKYENQLNNVDKSVLKGQKSAAKELVTLRLLRSQIENTNSTNSSRTAAYDKLKKLYPDYLRGMSQEKVLAGGLTDIYDQLTASILQKAKAQAASYLIVENTKKELVLLSQLEKQREKTGNLQLEEAKKTTKNNILVNRSTQLFNEKDLAIAKVRDSLKEEAEITSQITKIQEDSKKLAEQIRDIGGIVPIGGDGVQNQVQSVISGLVSAKGTLLPIAAEIRTGMRFVAPETMEADELALAQSTKRMNETLTEFNEQAGQLIQGSITNTFAGLGQSIGNALATGGNVIKAVGSSLLSSLGGFLSDLGKMMIKYGVAAVAYSIASKALLNPLTALPSGIALIAAGTALSIAGGAIGGLLKKGSSGGSSRGVAGGGSSRGSSFSSDSSNRGSGSFSGGKVVFEIAGTKLVGVLSNTLSRNRALGGSLSLTG